MKTKTKKQTCDSQNRAPGPRVSDPQPAASSKRGDSQSRAPIVWGYRANDIQLGELLLLSFLLEEHANAIEEHVSRIHFVADRIHTIRNEIRRR